jgi:hypothetical protein
LTKVTGVDIVLHQGLHGGKPIIASDQLDCYLDTSVSGEGRVVVLFDDIHTAGFGEVNEISVEEKAVTP